MDCPKCGLKISEKNINIFTDIAQCPFCNIIIKGSDDNNEINTIYSINNISENKKLDCPKCNTLFLKEKININTDKAECEKCNFKFKISEILDNTIDDGFDLYSPPSGAWVRKENDSLIIGIDARNIASGFMTLSIVISCIVGFVVLSFYQIHNREVTLFLLFLTITTFLLPLIMVRTIFMNFFGKVEFTLDKYGGRILKGHSKIGITRKFTWAEIFSIREESRNTRDTVVILDGQKTIVFGMRLLDSRRHYLYRALKNIIYKVKIGKEFL